MASLLFSDNKSRKQVRNRERIEQFLQEQRLFNCRIHNVLYLFGKRVSGSARGSQTQNWDPQGDSGTKDVRTERRKSETSRQSDVTGPSLLNHILPLGLCTKVTGDYIQKTQKSQGDYIQNSFGELIFRSMLTILSCQDLLFIYSFKDFNY